MPRSKDRTLIEIERKVLAEIKKIKDEHELKDYNAAIKLMIKCQLLMKEFKEQLKKNHLSVDASHFIKAFL